MYLRGPSSTLSLPFILPFFLVLTASRREDARGSRGVGVIFACRFSFFPQTRGRNCYTHTQHHTHTHARTPHSSLSPCWGWHKQSNTITWLIPNSYVFNVVWGIEPFTLCYTCDSQGQQLHQGLSPTGRRSDGHPLTSRGTMPRGAVRATAQPGPAHRWEWKKTCGSFLWDSEYKIWTFYSSLAAVWPWKVLPTCAHARWTQTNT